VLLLGEVLEERRKRQVDHLAQVAIGDAMPEEVLRLP
jgi:hypothetical protein